MDTETLFLAGDELQAYDSGPLKDGHIYDSNLPTLASLLTDNKIPHIVGGIARDSEQSLVASITALLDQNVDIIVSTGSVSMGDKDMLRAVLTTHFSAEIYFARVHMKPGKPTTFASFSYGDRKRLFLGLPGNPVSATVTSNLYLIPLCRKMAGQKDFMYRTLHAKLQHDIHLDARPEYHRAILCFPPASQVCGDSIPQATSTGNLGLLLHLVTTSNEYMTRSVEELTLCQINISLLYCWTVVTETSYLIFQDNQCHALPCHFFLLKEQYPFIFIVLLDLRFH